MRRCHNAAQRSRITRLTSPLTIAVITKVWRSLQPLQTSPIEQVFIRMPRHWRTLLKNCSSREAAEKIKYRRIDLVWALLLRPVSATRQHPHGVQCRDEMLEIGQQLIHAGGAEHKVAV